MGKDPKLPTIPELDNARIYIGTPILYPIFMCKKPWSSRRNPEKSAVFWEPCSQAENRELRKKLVETLRKGAGSAEPSPLVFWVLLGCRLKRLGEESQLGSVGSVSFYKHFKLGNDHDWM